MRVAQQPLAAPSLAPICSSVAIWKYAHGENVLLSACVHGENNYLRLKGYSFNSQRTMCGSVMFVSKRSAEYGAVTLTQREDLPYENTKGPDVTLSRVDLVKNGLRCHPLERQSGLCRC